MTQLKEPTVEDIARGGIWASDPDITSLDPPAGEVREPLIWSIYTDGDIHIGFVSRYNLTNEDVEVGIRIGEKAFWGQGHGTWAFNEMLKHCWKSGMTRVHLKVLPSNTRAIRLYQRCGFKRCGERIIRSMKR